MSRSRSSPRNGFSLVELVIVVGLLVVLGGILLRALQEVRETANRAQCTNNLRQIAIGTHDYHDSYKRMPPAVGIAPPAAKSPVGTGFGPVFWHLLPFIEQAPLYNAGLNNNRRDPNFGQYSSVWLSPLGMPASQPVKIYTCPKDQTGSPGGVYQQWLGTTSYAGNWLVFGTKGGARIPATFQDGTSQTIMYTERYQVCHEIPCGWGYPVLAYSAPVFAYYTEAKFQVHPDQDQCDPALPQSIHPKGIQVAMADASVRLVSNGISPQTWWYACTPAGNDILGADWVQ
jgi:hypothetical protein